MKKLFYIFCLVGAFFSCSEEELENTLDFSSPYVIQDNPNDPVQHRCYEIYQKYGVSIFFKDTIQSIYQGTDYLGYPVYKHETLDLAWNFTNHSGKDVKYSFDYLDTKEEQENALRFAEIHLANVSKSMRPFCLFLTDSIYQNGGTVKSRSMSTFRVLAMSQLRDYSNEQLDSLSRSIINKTVMSKIKLNQTLLARFYQVSEKEGWYKKDWTDPKLNVQSVYMSSRDMQCKYMGPNVFFVPDEEFNAYFQKTISYRPGSPFNPYDADPAKRWTPEKFKEARADILRQIGQFGFISGDPGYESVPLSHLKSPSKADDLSFYVTSILDLGEKGFIERYGASTLVMKKYTILADFIKNELQVDLNKQKEE